MPDIINTFGRAVDHLAPTNPAAARQLLLAGFRAIGAKFRYFPDKRLPSARQYIAGEINRTVCRMLSCPENVALTSVFMPCELLHAMDITPMCAELYSAFINGSDAEAVFADAAEAEGIPETYCSYHKVLLGCAYTGVLPAPRFIVNTSLVCDANNLTFRELADLYHIPQYYVDVPPEHSEDVVDYVAGQLRELTAFLEDNTGRKLEEDRLYETLVRSRDTTVALRACMREKRCHTLPGDVTSEMYEIYMVHNGLGTPEAQRYARQLLADLQNAAPAHGLRLLWLHTIPIWQKPVRELFNLSDRVQILACDMNLEGLMDIDPSTPYESMARRLVYSRWNGGDERVAAAVEAADIMNADGAICFCHWGCKQTMGLSAVMKSELEKAGFPTLILNGDGCDRRNASDGQTATRLNAFVEMLENANHEQSCLLRL
mgnify:CR=1 FL=1